MLSAFFVIAMLICGLVVVPPVPANAAVGGVQPTPAFSTPRDEELSHETLRQQIEKDWLRQAQAWQSRQRSDCVEGQATSTRADAAGACDGIKNGLYGFHTARQPNPWWQVDLGEAKAIAKVVVFNRQDYAPGIHNADNFRMLTSDDGKNWTLRYDNQGRPFGGVKQGKPLEVVFKLDEIRARFVRLLVPSETPLFFHLDEVEVYGPGAEAVNLALGRPADQSSVSQWSTAKPSGAVEEPPRFPIAETIARGRRLAADLSQAGVEPAPHLRELDAVERRFKSLLAEETAGALNAQSDHESGRSPLTDPSVGTARRAVQEESPRRGDPTTAAPSQRGDPTTAALSRRDDPDTAAFQSLYLEARRVVRRLAFANPLLNFDRLLFVKRFTQETYPDICLNHMPWVSRPGGDICVLSTASSGEKLFSTLADVAASSPPLQKLKVRHVLNRALGPGHVHGMDLWWDADRVVFGYAKKRSDQPPEGWLDRARSYELRRTEEPTHIFEVGIDGANLRQLTFGEWSDLDPTYLPSGEIAFVSERCGTSLQCNEYDKDETSCNLYIMNPDGRHIRRLSVNKDGDYLPRTLDNGLIVYTRWEYHERSWAFIQSLWTVRPDGTGADAIFKQHFVDPWALEDARSIPGSDKLVAIAAGHHTLAVGPVVVIDTSVGVNEPKGISIVTPDVNPPEGGMDGVPVAEGGVVDCGGFYSTPWALSEKYFLTSFTYGKERDATGYALYLIDVFGNKELVYRDPAISCFIPMPLRPRPTPPILADLTEPDAAHASCLVSDVGHGVDGIPPERIRYIRIAEPVGWPYDNRSGGQRYGEDHRYSGPGAERKNLANWTPVKILGDVPVESDGSAYFQVPVDVAVYFQLLDENRMELRRMRSFVSFQPGEVRACVGCHETRGESPIANRPVLAATRPPSVPMPPPWGDRPVSFLRDIQPVLDRRCVSCHSGLKPAGGLDFYGGLTSHDQGIAGYGYNRAYNTILEHGLVSMSEVRKQDASITPPLAYGSHKSKLIAALTNENHTGVVNLTEQERLRLVTWIDANAPYHDRFVNKRPDQPAYDLPADRELAGKIAAVHEKRCAGCHTAAEITRADWIDLRRPAQSLFLTAPLARESGGKAKCAEPVYKDDTDPDYRALLNLVQTAVRTAWDRPRRDLQSLSAPRMAEAARPRVSGQ